MRSLVALCLLLTGAVTPLTAQETTGRASAQSIVFRGYLDIDYVQASPQAASGFGNGQFTGRVLFRPAKQWHLLSVLAVAGNSTGVELALDRLFLAYHASDALRLSIGRHLTPFGWWNANIGRGAWLRTTISRPMMLNRERRLLPLHALGVMARGSFDFGGVTNLGYIAGVANGRGALPVSGRSGEDPNRNRAWMLGLRLRPGPLDDVRLGAFVYNDHVTLGAAEADERILSAHATWLATPLEFIAEYARIYHDIPALTGGPANRYTSDAYFVQLAFRLPGSADALKPYARIGRINVDDRDPVFINVGATDPALVPTQTDYNGYTIGVRWDVSEFGALKAEYRNESFGTADHAGTLAFQMAVRFGLPDEETILATAPSEGPVASPDRTPADAKSPDRLAGMPRTETGGEAVQPRPVAIVAHPGTNVDGLSLPELRRIFRGERQFWSGDRRIILLVRSPLPLEREIVLGQIYRMNEEEFRRLWLSKVFRNAAVSGPKMVEDIDTALELVAALPGAISFVSASRIGPESTLEIIPIEGKLPGDPGYPLQ